MSDKVFILDEIVTKTGKAAVYRDAYLKRYAPGARARGMTLESVRLTPPLELKDGCNTLHFLWSVGNIGGFWGMRLGGTGGRPFDPAGREKVEWWEEAKDMTVSRRRSVLIDYAGTPVEG